MKKPGYLILIILGTLLAACATFQNDKKNNHEAICKQLKYQMSWSGAGGAPDLWTEPTGDQVQPTRSRAELETLAKNYHDEGCEE